MVAIYKMVVQTHQHLRRRDLTHSFVLGTGYLLAQDVTPLHSQGDSLHLV